MNVYKFRLKNITFSLISFPAKPPHEVHLCAVPAAGAVRVAGGGVVHLEGVDAVAAPDRLSGQRSDDGAAAAAQDAAQEGQVRRSYGDRGCEKLHPYTKLHPARMLRLRTNKFIPQIISAGLHCLKTNKQANKQTRSTINNFAHALQ